MKHRGHSQPFQLRGIFIRNDAAYDDQHIGHLFFFQQLHHARHDGVVRSGKNGQADDLHVFLQRGIDDHFRGLPEAGIDNLHAGIAQRASDDLRAPVVSVEAGFGDQDPDSMIHKRLRLRL